MSLPTPYSAGTVYLEKHVSRALEDVEYNLSAHDVGYRRWARHSSAYHIWKALKHLFWYSVGRGNEPHLVHAATRLLFAIQLCFERPPTRQPWAIYGVDKHV